MIDTIGSAIKRMFTTQKSRYMPMPDYNLSNPQEVRVLLPGRILAENYTKRIKIFCVATPTPRIELD